MQQNQIELSSTLFFSINECFLDFILVAKSATGVCAIMLGDHPDTLLDHLQARFPRAILKGDQSCQHIAAQLVAAPAAAFTEPLDIRGTVFQEQVWAAIKKIPAGATASYTDIARQMGAPKAVRAVAQACGANPVAIVIPCHRVVRQDGALSGYRWGVERKKILLQREAKI